MGTETEPYELYVPTLGEPGVSWGRKVADNFQKLNDDIGVVDVAVTEETAARIAADAVLADAVAVADADATTKANDALGAANIYTDTQLGLRTFKEPARAVATGNIDISNPGTAVFDTVTLVSGDRVLLPNQTDATQNWLYVFNGSSSAMTRTSDANTSAEIRPGSLVIVTEGTSGNRDKIWELQTDAPIVLGTTPLVVGLASGDVTGLATQSALDALDAEVIKTINGVGPVDNEARVPGVYRGAFADMLGLTLYVNDVVNDGTADRRVTIEHVAGASINLNNFASPASISPDTLIGVLDWTGDNVETDAKHGFWPVRSRLRFGDRIKLTRFRSRTVTDGVTTNASANYSSATAAFTSADEDSAIIGSGIPLGATILSVTDASNVVMTANATATATAVTTTFSPDVTTSTSPLQIDSDLDPLDPKGCIRLRGTGASSATVTKTLAAPVDISNSIMRVGVRLSNLRDGVAQCRVEASSNNFADSNYKYFIMNARNEFRVGTVDIWDTVGTGPADWGVSGTGASGDLTAIDAVRVRFQRDVGADIYLSLGYIDHEVITSTKAKCVIWLDDGFPIHWSEAADILTSYGFRATIAPNILEPTAMSPTHMRYLQEHHGWQVAEHARTVAEHTTITGDALRQNLGNSRHALNSLGLSGGDDFAWWGGLSRDLPNTRESRKMFRTSRLAIARVGETLPPVNPHATTAQQYLAGMSWTTDLQPWAEKAIVNKGVAQFVFHATTFTMQILAEACEWLNANRASIDVVTWNEAIQPYVESP